MRIINIVDSVSDVNYGIWHAAVVNAGLLNKNGYFVELWYKDEPATIPPDVIAVKFADTRINTLKEILNKRQLSSDTDVVVSHGAWHFPTRWGHYLKSIGFRWIYVPQGMLEPWPLQQKWLKKKIYFLFVEKRMVKNADVVRAVSQPEKENLKKFFIPEKIHFIPNGVKMVRSSEDGHQIRPVKRYLFISRLHHKKNIYSLVQAWLNSSLSSRPDVQLIIAGPDQGELQRLEPLLNRAANIEYLGAVFGEAKQQLLSSGTFFILPSFSEGLPSALLEAMGAGLIPILTEGCNLPEAFTRKLGIKIGTNEEDIRQGLEQSLEINQDSLSKLKISNIDFIRQHYSVEAITKMQLRLLMIT
jgi:glycosyltransferase involved in cell wall biosynthesis